MPRKTRKQTGPSGGGGAYANRTDMTQPAQAAPGQAYGQGQAQEVAQQAVPLPQEPDPFAGAIQAAKQFGFEGTPINAPSSRPHEPVTAGLASGPGGGPEMLNHQRKGLSDLLTRLSAETQSPVIQAMLENARRMGL
jgi:hypothetical protein